MADTLNADAAELVAQTLAHGLGRSAAAKLARVSRRTLDRRLEAQPEILDRARVLRAQLYDQAAGELAALASKAIQTLANMLAADNPGVQLQAANLVLHGALKLRESVDLAEQVAALERSAKRASDNGTSWGVAG